MSIDGKQPADATPLQRIRLIDRYAGVRPDWHIDCFSQLSVDALVGAGVETVLFDLDGCLTPAYLHDEVDAHAQDRITEMHAAGLTIALATNNEWELDGIVGRIGASRAFQPPIVDGYPVYKPEVFFFEQALKGLGEPDPATVAMIGDNPIDDVLGAQRLGMRTVLVDRLDPHGFFGD